MASSLILPTFWSLTPELSPPLSHLLWVPRVLLAWFRHHLGLIYIPQQTCRQMWSGKQSSWLRPDGLKIGMRDFWPWANFLKMKCPWPPSTLGCKTNSGNKMFYYPMWKVKIISTALPSLWFHYFSLLPPHSLVQSLDQIMYIKIGDTHAIFFDSIFNGSKNSQRNPTISANCLPSFAYKPNTAGQRVVSVHPEIISSGVLELAHSFHWMKADHSISSKVVSQVIKHDYY